MDPFLTVLIAIYLYPILGFIIYRLSKNNRRLRKNAYLIVTALFLITYLGFLFKVSFTVSVLNWIMITTPFLFLCVTLWWTKLQKNLFINSVGVLAIYVIYFLSYFLGTFGILGVGFAVSDHEIVSEKWFDDGYIFREYHLGNATSDYGGIKVTISKTIPWFPLFDKQVYERSYNLYGLNLKAHHNPERDEFYLEPLDSTREWRDTIRIE